MPLLLVDLDDTLVDRRATSARWRRRHLPWSGERVWRVAERHLQVHRFVCRVAALFERSDPRSYRLEDGVAEALARVRRAGWTVVVITNGNRRTQPAKVRSADLDRWVDAVVISSHEGFAKPDPRMFHVAAERAGADLRGAWAIGDDLSQEIAGAHRLGLRSVWLNPDGRPASPDVDLQAGSFSEAVALMLHETGAEA